MFRLFRYRSEKSKQTEKICSGFAKKHTEKQPKQIEFQFVSVRTEKKINGFDDPIIENVFWIFFGLFQQNTVSVVSLPVRNTKTNRNKPKKCFWFRETNRKTTEID